MKHYRWLCFTLLSTTLLLISVSLCGAETAQISDATEECIGCHAEITPGIVADWQKSRHSYTTPAHGLSLPEQQRRISVDKLTGSVAD